MTYHIFEADGTHHTCKGNQDFNTFYYNWWEEGMQIIAEDECGTCYRIHPIDIINGSFTGRG